MELTIIIEMKNAAFEDAQVDEVARILAEMQERGDWAETLYHGGKIVLRDVNGNVVGRALVSAA